MQRIEEVSSLRVDCLKWEEDERLGRIPIICGETTKTDLDSDARWPTSPSVEKAVAAMTLVSRLRIRCAAAHPEINPSSADLLNPYLYDRSYEPWASGPTQRYSVRPYPSAYKNLLAPDLLLFEHEKLQINEDDIRIAKQLTPNLSPIRGFEVGKTWPLSWHQLRRTGAINMFASGLLSDSSIQFQMKHSSRQMSLYYGRGHTKLHLNQEVESLVKSAMHETMTHKIHSTLHGNFISPHGQRRKDAIISNIIREADFKSLSAHGRLGKASFREIRIGACTKRSSCSYGGIESISHCTGSDGTTPCADVLYDSRRVPSIEKEVSLLKEELADLQPASPRHKSLLVEHNGLEIFLNAFRNT
ncbi:hypothetical protein [Paucibacter sp. B51]|uniref:hypothetical protein n=1 Tax=Paucibacter sp. B51 TaxID=2993315 RepID=UPI0022EBB945|nr:hypothetical protein [Paucibacter sp. B51]